VGFEKENSHTIFYKPWVIFPNFIETRITPKGVLPISAILENRENNCENTFIKKIFLKLNECLHRVGLTSDFG
jgi:hypothetical protein